MRTMTIEPIPEGTDILYVLEDTELYSTDPDAVDIWSHDVHWITTVALMIGNSCGQGCRVGDTLYLSESLAAYVNAHPWQTDALLLTLMEN